MTVVDFHTHFLQPEVMMRSAPNGVLTGFGARPFEPLEPDSPRARQTAKMFDTSAVLADMDARGIDVHVLSSSTIVQGTGWAQPAEQAQLEAKVNDEAARWVALAPQRFVGSFTLPLRDIDLALAELERATGRAVAAHRQPARRGRRRLPRRAALRTDVAGAGRRRRGRLHPS